MTIPAIFFRLLQHADKDCALRGAIAATALVEGLTLVSADPAFDAYGVTRLW
jgi:PIN domain nuclease of toxin-antitoxin system